MRKYFCLILYMLPFTLLAQQTVKGIITDDNKLPLPGASILIKGTNIGAVSDFDGKFTIDLKDIPSSMVISYLGYVTQEILITSQTNITVVLEGDQESLDEVVVIGYGSVNKKDLTGSVSSIKPKDVDAQQARDVQNLIQGRVAGVRVSANGTEPGATTSINIRGASSLTGSSQPLYVIDGIIMDSANEGLDNATSTTGTFTQAQNPISAINPNDIADIQILKDASATAIYGSRGANGVVIITTKRGTVGKAKINFFAQTIVGEVVRNIDVLETKDYANYQNDFFLANGGSQDQIPYTFENGSIFKYDSVEDTTNLVNGVNWANDIYGTSITQKYRISASGGEKGSDYFISAGFTKNEGVIPRSSAEQVDFNININQQLNDKLKLGIKTSGAFTDLVASRGTEGFGGANFGLVNQIILSAPILNFSANNDDFDDIEGLTDGPRAWKEGYDDLSTENRLLARVNLDYKISDVFSYRFRFGGDYRTKIRNLYFGLPTFQGMQNNGLVRRSTLDRFRYNIDNTLSFKKRFNKNHRINGALGFVVDQVKIKQTFTSASGFSNHALRSEGLSFAENITPLVLSSEFPSIYSFLGRVNYTLKNRYLFTATFRADGSSRFAKGNRWGYFPAMNFAWKIKEEAFLKNSESISDLKLRIGYGQVGNQNIRSYQFLSPFIRTSTFLSAGANDNLIAVVPSNLANTDLRWESQEQYNVGLDLGLFNNRVNTTIDAYYKNSKDLLINIPIPPNTGFSSFFINQANLINKGIEFLIDADIVKSKNFTWNLSGNIAVNRNEISNLGLSPQDNAALGEIVAFEGRNVSGGGAFRQPANIFIEGRQPGLFYGLETNGIIKTTEELATAGDDGVIGTADDGVLNYGTVPLEIGDVRFVDQNGDGSITSADRTIIGNPNPDFTYGFSTSFKYKNLSLSLLFNGVYGNDIVNGNLTRNSHPTSSPTNVLRKTYFDAFDSLTNSNGNYPSLGANAVSYAGDFSDRIVEDGSFLRLSFVNLDYNLPVDNFKGIQSATISVSGQNLFLITNYSGYDPEVNSFAYDPLRIGLDWGTFPNQRTFSLGLNVTF